MTKTNITIHIGDRSYPLVVDADDAVRFQEAATNINNQMEAFSKSYPKTDRIDLLSMAALALATQPKLSADALLSPEMLELLNRIEKINQKIEPLVK